MITEKDLQEAIAECKGVRSPNSSTCMKLAAYYTIKDHLFPERELTHKLSSYSYAATDPQHEIVNTSGDSEFLRVVNGKNSAEVLSIMDELMGTLNVINPRLYEGVMTKLLL